VASVTSPGAAQIVNAAANDDAIPAVAIETKKTSRT